MYKVLIDSEDEKKKCKVFIVALEVHKLRAM